MMGSKHQLTTWPPPPLARATPLHPFHPNSRPPEEVPMADPFEDDSAEKESNLYYGLHRNFAGLLFVIQGKKTLL